MDKLNKLLRGWSGRQEPQREHIDSLAGKISRSVEGIKPGDERKREPAAPLRVKLGYSLSGALVTAVVFLVFMDARQPGGIDEFAEKPAELSELALREEPLMRARRMESPRRMEHLAGIADRERDALKIAAPEISPRLGRFHDREVFPPEIIARRLADYGWGPIGEDVVRLVRQPFEVAARGNEVNLQTSEVIVYPGINDREEPWIFRLSDEGRETFLELVKSGDFFDIPHRDERAGFDGTWYFIEADISGRYHWILHWQPEEDAMLEIFRVVENEADIAKKRLRRDE